MRNINQQREKDKEGLEHREKVVGAFVGSAAVLGYPGERDQVLRTRHNYRWTHPSGEVTKVQGFSPRMLKDFERGMRSLDERTRLDQKFGTTIQYTASPNPRMFGIFPSGAHALNYQGKTRFGSKAMNTYFDPSAMLVHETGHAIDVANSHIRKPGDSIIPQLSDNAPNVARAFGWKEGGDSPIAFRNFVKTESRSKINPKAYQSSDLIEDFAEQHRALHGFRKMTRRNPEVGDLPRAARYFASIDKDVAQSMLAAQKEELGRTFKVRVVKSGREYMNENVMRPRVAIDRVNISRAPIFNTRNVAVALGGTALVGGGYYYLRHRKEINRKIDRWQDKNHHFFRSHAHELGQDVTQRRKAF